MQNQATEEDRLRGCCFSYYKSMSQKGYFAFGLIADPLLQPICLLVRLLATVHSFLPYT
jgi:hypothetical protein